MLKEFNLLYENILKEYKIHGRIRLPKKDHKLISELTKELRKEVKKELKSSNGFECSGRFDDDDRQIVDVESYLSDDIGLKQDLLVPVDEKTMNTSMPKREFKEHELIIPSLKELIKKALKEAAQAEYYYKYENKND